MGVGEKRFVLHGDRQKLSPDSIEFVYYNPDQLISEKGALRTDR
jgi:hypothetical protein